ncbi:hypothetical protein [Bacillus sp. FSL R5-0659]|uniref:hypothetical protein n=1 Tax=Bacillus sp. FSL R5-0659 TaxID=2954590 RepID=UPI0030F84395
MTKCKTEKRKENVGERILITNVDVNETRYENGAVLDVIDSQGRVVHDKKGRLIYDHEYEVIVGEHKPAPNLDEMDCDELIALVEDAMKALRTRSYKNGYDQGRFDAEIEATHGTYEKSDQQKRDDIVAKAKEDVRRLLESDYGHDHEFIVNTAKRTVVDLRKIKGCTNIVRRGIAKCAPTDCFNAHIGKAIALRRALGWSVPAEYLNVPQPTEVRVGDVVEFTGMKGAKYVTTVHRIENGIVYSNEPYVDFYLAHARRIGLLATDPKTIDDTREGEGE